MRLLEKLHFLEELHRHDRIDEATFQAERRKLLGEETEGRLGSWQIYGAHLPKVYLVEHCNKELAELQGLRWLWIFKDPSSERQRELAYLYRLQHPQLLPVDQLEAVGSFQSVSFPPLTGAWLPVQEGGYALLDLLPILEQLATLCDAATDWGLELGWLRPEDLWLTEDKKIILWSLGWHRGSAPDEKWLKEEALHQHIPLNQMVWGALALQLLGGSKSRGNGAQGSVNPLALIGAALGAQGEGGSIDFSSCMALFSSLQAPPARGLFSCAEGVSFEGYEDAQPFDRVILSLGELELPFVFLPPMDDQSGSRPQGLFVSIIPITQELFRSIMGVNPSHVQSDKNPVERVSWRDALLFCNRLSALLGLSGLYRIKRKGVSYSVQGAGFGLLTRNEWAYAAGAGGNPEHQRWDEEAARGRAQPVGQLAPSGWGLYDMLGNVWEWVGIKSTPEGGAGGSCRSGMWELEPEAFLPLGEETTRADLGFRIVLRDELGW